MLAGVVEVHDLGGLGEVLGSEVPDPGRAVAGEYELADAGGTAAAGLSGHQDPEFDCGCRVVRGRARVADRAALPIGAGLGRGDRSRMKDTSRIYRDRT